MFKGLREMLKELMDNVKVNQPSIDPMEILNRQDMSLAHRQDRQMLAKGGDAEKEEEEEILNFFEWMDKEGREKYQNPSYDPNRSGALSFVDAIQDYKRYKKREEAKKDKRVEKQEGGRVGYSLGGILSKMSRKLLAKHRKDNVVKVLKKEVDNADKKLKDAKKEYEKFKEDFYIDPSTGMERGMEGYDFDAGGGYADAIREIQDDRQKLAFQLERRLYDLEKKENPDVEYFVEERDFIEDTIPEYRRPGYIDRLEREMDPEKSTYFDDDIPFAEGGNVDAQMADMMEGPTHTMPDGTVMPGATHGEYEAMMPKEGMVSDEEMEEDYVEFIMSEALEPEEQQYLSERLVEDDQLSMIFDKVVETASEFSGSGPVEGPGTGISDSIPARLSDGEFVMTAKATDAIGADTLDELMALAEQEADAGRQMKAIGGEAKSEVEKLSSTVIEEDPINRKNKEVMRALDPRLTLFAS